VFAVLDREARAGEQSRPLAEAKTAAMARIAMLLEVVVSGRPVAQLL
jgi:hypothetical protein